MKTEEEIRKEITRCYTREGAATDDSYRCLLQHRISVLLWTLED